MVDLQNSNSTGHESGYKRPETSILDVPDNLELKKLFIKLYTKAISKSSADEAEWIDVTNWVLPRLEVQRIDTTPPQNVGDSVLLLKEYYPWLVGRRPGFSSLNLRSLVPGTVDQQLLIITVSNQSEIRPIHISASLITGS
ncbi:hypothetical protein Ciccas_006206 [Cichlidogyrus casuarinus]|uniref:Uncharacterized protein n=1 Tax=Cichlidogyrus casuarinus TaxID=1844966 RepID=A0ABD2Q6F8_9PLAT